MGGSRGKEGTETFYVQEIQGEWVGAERLKMVKMRKFLTEECEEQASACSAQCAVCKHGIPSAV
jgi:hypothetical protein